MKLDTNCDLYENTRQLPEEELLLAIVRRSILDIAGDSDKEKAKQSALWVLSDDIDHPLAFQRIMEALDISSNTQARLKQLAIEKKRGLERERAQG